MFPRPKLLRHLGSSHSCLCFFVCEKHRKRRSNSPWTFTYPKVNMDAWSSLPRLSSTTNLGLILFITTAAAQCTHPSHDQLCDMQCIQSSNNLQELLLLSGSQAFIFTLKRGYCIANCFSDFLMLCFGDISHLNASSTSPNKNRQVTLCLA